MTNNNLKSALESLIAERIIDTIPSEPDHVFSKRFERHMKKLIRNQKSYQHPKRISSKRLVVCIIAAVLALFSMAMSVTTIRETFINFFTKIFNTHTVVQSVPDNNAPRTFEDIYLITAGLENHTLIEYYETPTDIIYIYDNEQSQIRFKQTIKEFYDVNANSEGYELERVYVNGNEGYYIDMLSQNSKYLSWDNGDYIITITIVIKDNSCKFSKESHISMAESVKNID